MSASPHRKEAKHEQNADQASVCCNAGRRTRRLRLGVHDPEAVATMYKSGFGRLDHCRMGRRSERFAVGSSSRHFLSFSPSICREDRVFLFMSIFAFRDELVPDSSVTPNFTVATYTPEQMVEVRVVSDPRHPAYGQAGLYARENIPGNTIVTPYAGFIEVFGTSCNSRTYTMGFGSISDDYALDAEFVGNYGRFANDPRGVEGTVPNLSAESRMSARGECYTALVSKRQILAGEEILMSYGKQHILGSVGWGDIAGRALTRRREGGAMPFPEVAATAAGGEAPFSYELLWECVQCGMYNKQHYTNLVIIESCTRCGSPKLSGARLLATLSTAPIDHDRLHHETQCTAEAGDSSDSSTAAGHGKQPEDAHNVPPSSPVENRSHKKGSGSSGQRRGYPSSAMAKSEYSSVGGSPTSPTGSSATQATPSNAQYSSCAVEWPMNIPFLPWQVWDPAVPTSVVSQHSTYECPDHLFIYQVDYPDSGSAAAILRAQREKERQVKAEEETAKRLAELRAAGSHKRGRDMWIDFKDNEVEGDNYSRSVTVPTAVLRAHLYSEYDDDQEGESRRDTGERRTESVTHSILGVAPIASYTRYGTMRQNTSGDVLGLLDSGNAPPLNATPHPLLSALLDPHREGERLIVLPHSIADREAIWVWAERRLCAVRRRLFTGKSFQAGEVLGSVGGVVRHRGRDHATRRPAESPLVIPMLALVPTHWRHQPSALQDGTDQSAANGAGRRDDHDEQQQRQWAREQFMRQMSELELVVTNEWMHCPCLVTATGVGDPNPINTDQCNESPARAEDHDDAEADNTADAACLLIETQTNVCLTLTVDHLGSPFVAAVATRHIAAFDSLLARLPC